MYVVLVAIVPVRHTNKRHSATQIGLEIHLWNCLANGEFNQLTYHSNVIPNLLFIKSTKLSKFIFSKFMCAILLYRSVSVVYLPNIYTISSVY